MSRYDAYEGDEMFPGQWWLWEENLRRTISGRKGQQALRDLEAALLALPEPKLISSNLALNGQVCAMGALVLHRLCAQGEDREAVMVELEQAIDPDADEYGTGAIETAEMGKAVGLTFTLAWHIGEVNDEWRRGGEETPEERYERVLAWTRKRILEPA